MSKEKIGESELASLRRQLRFLRILSAAAAAACCAFAAGWALEKMKEEPPASPFVQRDAPHSGIVEAVIGPLRYSGYHDFVRPDVSLGIDFRRGIWALRNVHSFDSAGNVLLNEGRYGVCEDLAAYAYQKLKPYFPEDRYLIEFVRAVESSYFQSESGGQHVVLRIADLAGGRDAGAYKKVYILDPSLRRYGSPDMFDDYKIVGEAQIIPFLETRDRDSIFDVNQGPPILINRLGFINLFVMREGARFDPDNFQIMLTATRRYRYARKPLFVVRRKNGYTTYEETEYPIGKIMKPSEYKKLKETVIRLYRDFEKKLPVAAGASGPA